LCVQRYWSSRREGWSETKLRSERLWVPTASVNAWAAARRIPSLHDHHPASRDDSLVCEVQLLQGGFDLPKRLLLQLQALGVLLSVGAQPVGFDLEDFVHYLLPSGLQTPLLQDERCQS